MRLVVCMFLSLAIGAVIAGPAPARSFELAAAGHAEITTVIDKTISASVLTVASDGEFFRRFGPESDNVTGHVHFRSPEILSGLREDRAFGDNPDEPSLWLIPVNWDARTGSLISIQAIFGDLPAGEPAYAAIAAELRAALIRQVWDGRPEGWAQAIEEEVAPDPMALSVFTFIPSTVPDRIGGIAWHFEPETVAPRSKGVISIVIPQKQLRDVMRPEWQELFAGDPIPIPPAQEMLEAERLAEAQPTY